MSDQQHDTDNLETEPQGAVADLDREQRSDELDHHSDDLDQAGSSQSPGAAESAESAESPESADDAPDDDDAEGGPGGEDSDEDEEDRRRRAEEFAREHDPANHDIEAGEEFRHHGDWTAQDGEPQVLEGESADARIGHTASTDDAEGDGELG